MNKAIAAVIAFLILIAYGIWFEFFHPLSYSNYRGWIQDCTTHTTGTLKEQVPDCAMSYSDWQDWIQRKAEASGQGKP